METNISDFQTMVDSIVKSYINALGLNANSENRIHLEFSDKLDNLNITVVELRERLRKSEEISKEAESRAEALQAELARAKEEAEKSKQNALESAEIAFDKAVIEAEKKTNTELKKITNEATSKQKELLDKLHAEQTTVVELTKELAELKANMKKNTTDSTLYGAVFCKFFT